MIYKRMKHEYFPKIDYNLISIVDKGNDMRLFFGFVVFILVSLFSFSVFADDDPIVVEGADEYNRMQCIDNETQNCINDACLNSESTDCQENCRKLAEDKCQEAEDQ